MVLSPWLLGYHTTSGSATANGVIFGLIIAILAIAALSTRQAWEEWVNLVLGIWLILSPWLLGFHSVSSSATWNDVIFGLLVGIVALWATREQPKHA
jgi:multisubunit Na+/H+ antiporter MnhE subunit